MSMLFDSLFARRRVLTRFALGAVFYVVASGALLSTPIYAAENPVSTPATLPEVRVTEGRVKINAPGSLRDELVKTESVDAKAIEHSNASNLTEALDKRPGIAVQVECSVCNVRNITLNNLPGRFTTLLIDGVPLYSSVSTAYGLDSVPVQGVERIDIARGAGASLIAPEALSGTVNIVSKRPTREESAFRLTAGDRGAYRADAYWAQPLSSTSGTSLGALTAMLDYHKQDAFDGAGTGISQYTGFTRTLAGLGYFLDDVGGFKLRGRIDAVDEKRGGGPLSDNYGAIKANRSGNPFDFSRGPNGSPVSNGWVAAEGGPDTLANGASGVIYDGGLSGLSQIIDTRRTQGTLIGERSLGAGTLRLAFGYAQHHQDSYYGADGVYVADQNQAYLEASYRLPWGKSLVTAGVNYRYEDLKSHGIAFSTSDGLGVEEETAVNGVDNYRYRTPALFFQVYRPFFDDRLELNGSLRLDQHNIFGTIVSPRFNALFHHSDAYASRLSLGRGFRAPTSFFEQEHGLLADKKIIRQIDKPEISDNVSYALSYASDRFSWVGSLNLTRIRHFATLSAGQDDPEGSCTGCVTIFAAAPDPVTVKGLDWVGTYQITPSVAISLGLEKFRYQFTPGTLNFARPETRTYLSLDAEVGGWDLTAKWTWTGRQNLARFYNYAETQQYNLDGTKKPDWSPSFSVVDARAEYRFNKRYAIFLGVDNLFDYQQAKHDSYLWVDASGSLDVTHIWGPNRGRYVYGGMRVAF